MIVKSQPLLLPTPPPLGHTQVMLGAMLQGTSCAGVRTHSEHCSSSSALHSQGSLSWFLFPLTVQNFMVRLKIYGVEFHTKQESLPKITCQGKTG